MSHDLEPPRLLDPASGASPELREVLASAQGDAPSAAQLARLAERLAPLTPPPAHAPTSSTPPTPGAAGASMSALPKLAALVGLAALLGLGAWRLWPRGNPAPPRQPSTNPALPAPPPTPASPPASPAAIAQPAPTPHLQLDTPSSPGPSPTRPPRPRSLPPPTSSPGAGAEVTEMQLLGAAHQALRASTPARALELTREHATRFPSGTLTEEREAIAIEALVRLGRGADARARLARFGERFPASTYQRRLAELVAR